MATDATKAALGELEQALTQQLDAYEGETKARLQRLKDVQSALGDEKDAEAVSASATAKWYSVFSDFFYST